VKELAVSAGLPSERAGQKEGKAVSAGVNARLSMEVL
jgi:hypothetical protein